MATVSITLTPRTAPEITRQYIQKIAEEYQRRFTFTWRWIDSDQFHFNVTKGLAKGTKGIITFRALDIYVQIELPYHLSMFKKIVADKIHQLNEYSSAYTSQSTYMKKNSSEDLTPVYQNLSSSIARKNEEVLYTVNKRKTIITSADNFISWLKFFTITGQGYEILSSPFWRLSLIFICMIGCIINVSITIYGTNLLVIVQNPVPVPALMLLACFPIFILFLSKQILMNRMGGGTLLSIFFMLFWFVCLVFNIATIYWVYKVSYRLDIPQNVQLDVARLMKEFLPLGAAVITTIPPILLGVLLFPEIKQTKSLNHLHKHTEDDIGQSHQLC